MTIPRVDQPKRRGALMPTLIVLAALTSVFLIFTAVWTDRLWYRSMEYGQVFSVNFWTQVWLFLGFGALMALGVVGSTILAYRLRPPTRSGPLASETLERYREQLETRFRQIMLSMGAVVGVFGGLSAAGNMPLFLAWRNKTPFGQKDEVFGLDISFFMFDYPWWRWVISFLIAMFVMSALSAAVVHYVMGAMRLDKTRKQKISPSAQAQLSVLIGLAVLAFAVGSWFDRFGLELSGSQLLTGMGYTDDHARMNAYLIVSVITAICAVLFFVNVFLRRWMLPIASIVLLLVSSTILSMIYPALVQQFTVRPNEPDMERPYIERHIRATRQAYGIDKTEIIDYSAETKATAGQLRQDAESLPAIRLIDPAVVSAAFEQLQQVRGFYQFPKVLDVDRYQLAGKETDSVVAVRELDSEGIPSKTWNNIRTEYTHGYGLVAAYGNRRQPGGEPEWIAKDMPPAGELKDYEPRIYFGEKHSEYSIVGAPAGQLPIELDTPGGGDQGGERKTTYTGKGGVPVGNPINRVLYATKFGDLNMLLSGRVNSESKIIYDRTPKQRVEGAAPWLTVDSNAYPAIVDGRVVWILDAYTTSNNFPNSHRVQLDQATSDTQTAQGAIDPQAQTPINYIRNSVKAVVDAYDGTVKLYAWDEADPILQTWRKAYPNTVLDRSRIPNELLAHLRYPDDLFKVQREVLGRYHVTDPQVWYRQNDLWEIPVDPVTGNNQKENPFLLSIKWPGDKEAYFSQTSTFVPRERQNLAAYLAVNAEATSPEYGRMRILRMSGSRQIDGPSQTFTAMQNDPVFTNKLLPYRNSSSAQVEFGNLLTLPVGGGLLYAQPIYVQRTGTGSYPTLTFVAVRFGEHVGIGTTLQEALDEVFQGDAGATTGENPTQEASPNEEGPKPTGVFDQPAAVDALKRADAAYADANKALKEGDLATYQKKNQEAEQAVKEALRAAGQ